MVLATLAAYCGPLSEKITFGGPNEPHMARRLMMVPAFSAVRPFSRIGNAEMCPVSRHVVNSTPSTFPSTSSTIVPSLKMSEAMDSNGLSAMGCGPISPCLFWLGHAVA